MSCKKLLKTYINDRIAIHTGLPMIEGHIADMHSSKGQSLYIPPHLRSVPLQENIHKNKGIMPDSESITEGTIYMLQSIQVGTLMLNLFFDTGCSELVMRKGAIEELEEINRASKERGGPIMIGGVGDQKAICKYGIYKVILPLHNGNNACLSGPCIDQITSEFPEYPLHGRVQRDIHDAYIAQGGKVKNLSRLPEKVGGGTDVMLGNKGFFGKR